MVAQGLVFTDSHNSPLGTSNGTPLTRQQLLSFPQFHRTHHNNKLYSFQKSVKGPVVVIVVVKNIAEILRVRS
jgi:hypothetical protein